MRSILPPSSAPAALGNRCAIFTRMKDDASALMTAPPGPEVGAVHDRPPTLIRLSDWGRLLTNSAWPEDLVRPSPASTLKMMQLR
jgi:putative SOS response-associated peptidase YedK